MTHPTPEEVTAHAEAWPAGTQNGHACGRWRFVSADDQLMPTSLPLLWVEDGPVLCRLGRSVLLLSSFCAGEWIPVRHDGSDLPADRADREAATLLAAQVNAKEVERRAMEGDLAGMMANALIVRYGMLDGRAGLATNADGADVRDALARLIGREPSLAALRLRLEDMVTSCERREKP